MFLAFVLFSHPFYIYKYYKMGDLNEIVNQDQIKSILESFDGEEQLKELKFYLLTFQPELKEIGIDGVNLAWQIYKTNQK